MGVHPEGHLRRHQLLDPLGGVVDRHGIGGAAGVLHADAVDLDVTREQPPADVDVELGRVDLIGIERQSHERDTDLMVHSRINNWFSGFY